MSRLSTVLVILLLTAAPAAAAAPVLGVSGLMGEYGKGWGAVKPHVVFNGGSPGGLARHIKWRGWGRGAASGRGRIAQYRPEGGYYSRLVKLRLRVSRIRSCGGRRAYTRMLAQAQEKPGGPWGDWFPWTLDLCDQTPDTKACGRAGGARQITAFDVRCGSARRLARRADEPKLDPDSTADGYLEYRYRVRGYLCKGYKFDDGPASITCSRRTRVVTFKV